MVDLDTGRIEICTVPSTQVNLGSNQVDFLWLKVIVDWVKEFQAEYKTTVQADYSIKVNSIFPKTNKLIQCK